MAEVLSLEHSVKIFTTHRYDYDEGHRDVYDFAGLRFIILIPKTVLSR